MYCFSYLTAKVEKQLKASWREVLTKRRPLANCASCTSHASGGMPTNGQIVEPNPENPNYST